MGSDEFLTNAASRHQVFLEGYKTNQVNILVPDLLDSVFKSYLSAFGSSELSEMRVREFKKALKTFKDDVDTVYSDYISSFFEDQEDFVVSESEFEAKTLNKAIESESVEVKAVAAALLFRVIKNTPMSMSGALPAEQLNEWASKDSARIMKSIRNEYFQDGTSASVLANIFARNSKGEFTSPVMSKMGRNATTETKSMLQFMSNQSRIETMKGSGVAKGYVWVSTLDIKTTDQCASLDGRFFEFGKGPTPPIHQGCRSTTRASLDQRFNQTSDDARRAARGASGTGTTSASNTYYSWLKTQPASFQDAAIGVSRGKLLRNGGLTSERFAQLSLNREFIPRTLKEMEQLEPLAFEKANI